MSPHKAINGSSVFPCCSIWNRSRAVKILQQLQRYQKECNCERLISQLNTISIIIRVLPETSQPSTLIDSVLYVQSIFILYLIKYVTILYCQMSATILSVFINQFRLFRTYKIKTDKKNYDRQQITNNYKQKILNQFYKLYNSMTLTNMTCVVVMAMEDLGNGTLAMDL